MKWFYVCAILWALIALTIGASQLVDISNTLDFIEINMPIETK